MFRMLLHPLLATVSSPHNMNWLFTLREMSLLFSQAVFLLLNHSSLGWDVSPTLEDRLFETVIPSFSSFHTTASYCWVGFLPSGVIYWLSSHAASRPSKVFEHLQLLPNGIWQQSSHGMHFVINDLFSHHIHFSVFLVKLVLILFLFAGNKSGFCCRAVIVKWLQRAHCSWGKGLTPRGVLLSHKIPVGRSGMFIFFSRWTAKFIRELSAILPPFSCIYIKEALVITLQRHYSPFFQRQLRAVQAKNYIRIS